jgi:molybdenum cofactor guanylyltransferase
MDPDPPSPPRDAAVSAIVLAGGRSSRFGRDKLSVEVQGMPLLHHAIRAVSEMCSEVVVVTAAGPGRVRLPSRVRVPIRTIPDRSPYPGPLAALAVGLDAAAHPVALIAGGDMHRLVPSVLWRMVELALVDEAPAVALMEDGALRPLPCLVRRYHRRTAEALVDEGNASLRALLAAVGARGIPEKAWRSLDPAGLTLVDVDRPEDLR